MRDSFLIWTQTDFHKTVGNTLDALLKSGAANLCLIESNCSNVLNAINNTGVNLQISNILLSPPETICVTECYRKTSRILTTCRQADCVRMPSGFFCLHECRTIKTNVNIIGTRIYTLSIYGVAVRIVADGGIGTTGKLNERKKR